MIAASASAEAAKVSGGMSILSPEIVTALFVGLSSLVTAIGVVVWGNNKTQKKIDRIKEELRIANDPLNVNKVDKPVTRGECQQYRCAIQKQLDNIGPAINRVFAKLDENDKRSEERAKETHRRMDPILQRVAACMAETELMKKIVTKEK